MNIVNHIEQVCEKHPQQIALHFEGKNYTYLQLNELANKLANALTTMDVREGDRVALLLPNIPAFIIAYLSVLKIGAIAATLNVMLKPYELTNVLQSCKPSIMITTGTLVHGLQYEHLPFIKHVIIVEGVVVDPHISLDNLLKVHSPISKTIQVEEDTPAVIVYTSGTTGTPKGAVLSHHNVIENMRAKNHYCGTQPNDKLLLFLPLFHCFGQNAILNNALQAGATVILQRRFDPKNVISAITQHQITMFNGVPTVYARLLNLNIEPQVFQSVKLFFTAGAPMPVSLANAWFKKYNQLIFEGYGMTESSPFATYNHDKKYKPGSVGTAIMGVQICIVDETGTQLCPLQHGEVTIRGHNVMLGYWNQPEATAQVIKSGWLYTGDIGYVDEEGYLYIVDRLKDMIIASGFKVYPFEIENILYEHPSVAETAVYGSPHPIKGEIIIAKIVLVSGKKATQDELLAFCRERIAAYKIPNMIQFVDELPKNATGKILKRELRQI